jgi:RES domain-containing protein
VSLPLQRWQGVVFRAHHPKWAYQPLSGEGAQRFGGRFNPLGTPALYTSLSPEGAWAEAQQGFAFKAQPMTLCAYRVDCDHVLDLSSREACAKASVDFAALTCPWADLMSQKRPVPSWELQKRMKGEGVAAIIVPSFAPAAPVSGRNMVFWEWSDALPHKVEVVDDFARLGS